MIIAIDGPSAAGKSTIAKLLASELGIDYIDTGAMYRAIALKVTREGLDTDLDTSQDKGQDANPDKDPDKDLDTDAERSLAALLDSTDVDISGGMVLLDGEDVSGLIRTGDISMQASRISRIPAVRQKLVALQREMGVRKSLVMDGRDIGSNVFPGADYKFFITAGAEVRADRRYRELVERGESASYEEVLADIKKRDFDDSHRALNPLVQTEDAILIVTDDLGIEEVLEEVNNYLHYCK